MLLIAFIIVLSISLSKQKDIRDEWYTRNVPRIFFAFLACGLLDLFIYYKIVMYILTH